MHAVHGSVVGGLRCLHCSARVYGGWAAVLDVILVLDVMKRELEEVSDHHVFLLSAAFV